MKAFESIAGLSWIFAHFLQNNLQVEVSAHYKELNVERLMLLMELDWEDGLRPSVLAKRMGRSKGTITSLIKHSATHGFVAMTPDVENKNAKLIYLTLKGKKIHDEMTVVLNEKLAYAIKDVPPEHHDIIKKALLSCIATQNPNWAIDAYKE